MSLLFRLRSRALIATRLPIVLFQSIDRIVSCGLTKDLGIANIDERLNFVARLHRRLAPATRHSIIL